MSSIIVFVKITKYYLSMVPINMVFLFMKVNILMAYHMVRERKLMVMVLFIMDGLKKVRDMVKEELYVMTVVCMRGTSIMD